MLYNIYVKQILQSSDSEWVAKHDSLQHVYIQ